MKTLYTVYFTGGETVDHEVDLPQEPGYGALRDIILPHLSGGEHEAELEHVSVLWNNEALDMFVDDLGALLHLPVNPKATEIYRNNWLTQHPDTDPESLSAIYGVAILFHRKVWY